MRSDFSFKSTYIYILCTMISVALLSCSVSSTNEKVYGALKAFDQSSRVHPDVQILAAVAAADRA